MAVVLGQIKKTVLFCDFPQFSGGFPAPSRPFCTSEPPNSGGFRPRKKESFIFHTFPAVFRPPHGRFALANRQIPVVLGQIKRKFYFPHFSGRFPAPSRRNWTSDPANSGGFRPEKGKVLVSTLFRSFSGPFTA